MRKARVFVAWIPYFVGTVLLWLALLCAQLSWWIAGGDLEWIWQRMKEEEA